MSTKEYPSPLTWARVLELAAQGHDHYDAALTSTRARQLVASVMEHFSSAAGLSIDETLAWSKCQGRLSAATALLRRVQSWDARQERREVGEAFVCIMNDVDRLLAGQPEAPKELDCVFMIAGNRYSVGDDGMTYALKPEAPKGQGATEEAHLLADIRLADALTATAERLAAANARIETLEEFQRVAEISANARIAELEAQHDADIDAIARAVRHEDAANARADAAERAEKEAVAALDANWVQHQRIVKAETERDQLAARVQGLVHWYSESPSRCTPEEREVLEACREMRLEEEDADDEPGEPVEVGEDCYIYTDDQHAIVRAELANRAAKAKREAK
jgi:hypothetical protein